MRRDLTIFALLASFAAGPACAQPAVQAPAEAPALPSDRTCASKFVGQWGWAGGDVDIKRDQTAEQRATGLTATWICMKDQLVLSWSNGAVQGLMLSADGNAMNGPGGAEVARRKN